MRQGHALLLAVAVVLVAACPSIEKGRISTANVADAVRLVVDRHDAYVQVDEDLPVTERDRALLQSRRARIAFEGEEYVRAEDVEGDLTAVLDRHDGYVAADHSLEDGERKSFLLTSELLRGVLEEARQD